MNIVPCFLGFLNCFDKILRFRGQPYLHLPILHYIERVMKNTNNNTTRTQGDKEMKVYKRPTTVQEINLLRATIARRIKTVKKNGGSPKTDLTLQAMIAALYHREG